MKVIDEDFALGAEHNEDETGKQSLTEVRKEDQAIADAGVKDNSSDSS